MLLFSALAFAQDGDDICWDCLTEFPLYRLDTPGDPNPDWRYDFYEAMSSIIIFGVIEGGGGLRITPGGNPIPIDPDWVLDLAVFNDSRHLSSQLSSLRASLDRKRIPYAVVTDIEDTLALDDALAIVTPASEAEAVAWATANSEALSGLDHPTLLFVQNGGVALEEIPAIR